VLKKRPLDPTNATVLEVAYARTGSMIKAGRIVAFVAAWGIVRRDLGRTPTVDEYAAGWKVPRSTSYKHLGEFRACFGLDTPDPILDRLGDRVEVGRGDLSGLVTA
jgi:hypothetical protein